MTRGIGWVFLLSTPDPRPVNHPAPQRIRPLQAISDMWILMCAVVDDIGPLAIGIGVKPPNRYYGLYGLWARQPLNEP